jgi:hypothetical protein
MATAEIRISPASREEDPPANVRGMQRMAPRGRSLDEVYVCKDLMGSSPQRGFQKEILCSSEVGKPFSYISIHSLLNGHF